MGISFTDGLVSSKSRRSGTEILSPRSRNPWRASSRSFLAIGPKLIRTRSLRSGSRLSHSEALSTSSRDCK